MGGGRSPHPDQVAVTPSVAEVVTVVAPVALFALGCMWIVGALTVYFRDLAQLVGLLVTATAAGAITATKIGATAQVSAASGAELYLVSNANAEGSTLREIKYPQLVTASNYCQIVQTPFGVTGRPVAVSK